MATGLQIASTIVQVVHDLVRDILSQLVGSAISWATEAVVTVGLATPWIISQVSSRVASWTAKISGKLTGLLRSCGKVLEVAEKHQDAVTAISGSGPAYIFYVVEAMVEAGASSGLLAALFTHSIALPHIIASGNADLIDRFVRPTLAGELIGSLAVTEPDGFAQRRS